MGSKSRIVGPGAIVHPAVRLHRGRRPMPGSRIVQAPPAVTVTLLAYMVEGTNDWHMPADHDDPVAVITEAGVIGLFLVVIVVGFWTSVRCVRREFT